MSRGDASTPPAGLDAGRLAPTRFSVDWVSETGSTNADLVAAAASGATDGTVLATDHQTAGRGRRERRWEAPPASSLLVSLLLRPDVGPGSLGALTAAVGLSARAACRSVAGVEVGLKWPNDLLAVTAEGERKLGGILAESVVAGDRVEAVVVGLGVNVSWSIELPSDLAGIAVALNHLGAPDIDRGALLTELLVDLDERLTAIGVPPSAGEGARRGWEQSVWRDWREATTTLGRQVTVRLVDGDISGRATDITDNGHLVVESDGALRVIDVGDVVHLR